MTYLEPHAASIANETSRTVLLGSRLSENDNVQSIANKVTSTSHRPAAGVASRRQGRTFGVATEAENQEEYSPRRELGREDENPPGGGGTSRGDPIFPGLLFGGWTPSF